ncbi:MAG: hypothetical protein JWM53_1760 [bacterium]|nr:hypothetical protein [bacterium]
MIVDIGASAVARCASCGGPLVAGGAPATVWDDDEPTERRPTSYVDELAARARR